MHVIIITKMHRGPSTDNEQTLRVEMHTPNTHLRSTESLSYGEVRVTTILCAQLRFHEPQVNLETELKGRESCLGPWDAQCWVRASLSRRTWVRSSGATPSLASRWARWCCRSSVTCRGVCEIWWRLVRSDTRGNEDEDESGNYESDPILCGFTDCLLLRSEFDSQTDGEWPDCTLCYFIYAFAVV